MIFESRVLASTDFSAAPSRCPWAIQAGLRHLDPPHNQIMTKTCSPLRDHQGVLMILQEPGVNQGELGGQVAAF
jgi:hypothetical protein